MGKVPSPIYSTQGTNGDIYHTHSNTLTAAKGTGNPNIVSSGNQYWSDQKNVPAFVGTPAICIWNLKAIWFTFIVRTSRGRYFKMASALKNGTSKYSETNSGASHCKAMNSSVVEIADNLATQNRFPYKFSMNLIRS